MIANVKLTQNNKTVHEAQLSRENEYAWDLSETLHDIGVTEAILKHEGEKVNNILPFLEDLLIDLKKHPGLYSKCTHYPETTYPNMVGWIEELLAACRENKEASIKTENISSLNEMKGKKPLTYDLAEKKYSNN
jgi:hypothetical protein